MRLTAYVSNTSAAIPRAINPHYPPTFIPRSWADLRGSSSSQGLLSILPTRSAAHVRPPSYKIAAAAEPRKKKTLISEAPQPPTPNERRQPYRAHDHVKKNYPHGPAAPALPPAARSPLTPLNAACIGLAARRDRPLGRAHICQHRHPAIPTKPAASEQNRLRAQKPAAVDIPFENKPIQRRQQRSR